VRVLLQRVSRASVSVDGRERGRIDGGYVALVGVRRGDTDEDVVYCADKTAHLRLFPDDDGRFDRSLIDVEGQVLAISQFTLYGDSRRGRRPYFGDAADPEEAEPLYEAYMERLWHEHDIVVVGGVFGAHMDVEIHNDGPVTLTVDSAERR
jgi:D-tyrosyl-tRNA(Tyr) deacylase